MRICKFHAQGKCNRGNRCRFRHVTFTNTKDNKEVANLERQLAVQEKRVKAPVKMETNDLHMDVDEGDDSGLDDMSCNQLPLVRRR